MEREIRTLQEIDEAVGSQEGRQEVARSMLRDGVDINIIAKYAGLPVDEICGLCLKSKEVSTRKCEVRSLPGFDWDIFRQEVREEIARNMLRAGINASVIAECTGLTVNEICYLCLRSKEISLKKHEVRTLPEIVEDDCRLKIARSMMQNGIEFNVVAKYTGLTVNDILDGIIEPKVSAEEQRADHKLHVKDLEFEDELEAMQREVYAAFYKAGEARVLRDISCNMQREGVDANTIAKYTHLSTNEILNPEEKNNCGTV